MTETFKNLQALVLKSEGNPLTLIQGSCFSGGGLSYALVLKVVEHRPFLWCIRYWNTGINDDGYIEIESKNLIIHEDRPMTPQRVLKALGKIRPHAITSSGVILSKMEVMANAPYLSTLVGWGSDLEITADELPEETQLKLIELLK